MGCDIHAHVEIKVDGKWHHYNHPDIGRNYWLFARMANVRNDGSIKPIAEPRGLPEDITFTTKFDRKCWSSDGHSDSWLSAKEVAVLGPEMETEHKKYNSKDYYYYEKEFGYLFGNSWDIGLGNGHPKQLQDARLVFWFDN